jgi:hypothetical protein
MVRHRIILVLARDDARRGQSRIPHRAGFERRTYAVMTRIRRRDLARRRISRLPRSYAAADFGRRPRRAAGRPGMLPAHESHKSATFDPRRASVKVTREVAPLFSPTSFPQLSQTSTVLRATHAPSIVGSDGR